MTVQKHLKNWFIAHKGNAHLPHALRWRGVSLGLALILVIQITFNFAASGQFKVLGYASDINNGDLLQLTNAERGAAGAPALQFDSRLNAAAMAKAEHMFAHDYWAHVAPDGTQPWFFIESAGYSYAYAGENLAKGFNTSAGTVQGWMDSSSHRDNLLNPTWEHVGLAVLDGTLQGSETTLVVAMYGQPHQPAPQPQSPVAQAEIEPEPPAPVPESEPEPETDLEPEESEEPEETEEESPDMSHLAGIDIGPTGQELAATHEVNYGPTRPLPLYRTLSWGEGATLFVFSGYLLTNTLNHTIIWRKRRYNLKRAKHIWFRTHPAIQAIILAIPIAFMLYSGLGTVL